MTDPKVDFLRELGSIGTGRATTALSNMLGGQLLKVIVPQAEMLSFEEMANLIGTDDREVAGIYITVEGEASGEMAFILSLDSALNLVKILTNSAVTGFDEIGISVLEEVGNIMVTSYLNALSELTGLTLIPSVPGVALDMAAAVWESILAGADIGGAVTFIRTGFATDEVSIQGDLVFLPNEEDFAKIARILGLEEY